MNKVLRTPPSRPPGPRAAGDAAILPEYQRKPGCRRTDDRLAAALAMLIGALWLATRPYYGIIQDARFYMVEALHQLHPARFADDLYFRFGSQGQFTVYSRAIAPLVSLLGVGPAEIVLTVIGQLLWLGALLHLAGVLLGHRRQALLSVAVLIALPGTYGFFNYGDPFATPRLFAEALTMWSMACLVCRRTGRALILLAASAAIHPLMTLPSLAVAFVYLALGQPLWWAAIAGGAMAAAGLSAADVQPFANLRITLDPQWFDIVKVRDASCFITKWSILSHAYVLAAISLAVLSLTVAEPRQRRLLGSALIVGIGGLAGTLVGADVFHNAFVIEIQQYRALWPLTLLANLHAVPTFFRLLGLGRAGNLVRSGYLAALAALFLSRFNVVVVCAAAAMMAITAVFAVWQYRTGRRLPLPARGFLLASLAIGGTVTILFIVAFRNLIGLWPENFRHTACSFVLIAAALSMITAIVVPAMDAARQPRRRDRLLPWLAAVLLALSLLGWDARTPWTRFVEAGTMPGSLAALLPRNASVYWEGGVELLWLGLQRPSYFSCPQGGGAMFFRGTAIAYRHRAESFWRLRTLDFDGTDQCRDLDRVGKAERTRADLREVCRREPALDYLVLTRPVADVTAKIWDSPVPYRYQRFAGDKLIVHEIDRFYVYSCAAVRPV